MAAHERLELGDEAGCAGGEVGVDTRLQGVQAQRVEPRRLGLCERLYGEVAERVAAPPGAMSYLSVFVQHLTEADVVAVVPRTAFEPAPAVDSAILRLRRRAVPPVEPAARETFYRVVQAGFRQRRKQIHNGLSRELPVDRTAVEAALAECGVDPDRRPQTVTVDEWVCLTARLAGGIELQPPPSSAGATPADGVEGDLDA